MKRIAYQGVKGAFSHLTARHAYGEHHTYIATHTFAHAFALVDKGEADIAVIPIENSLIGSIYENYDLLCRHKMHIIDEHMTRIEHCLLGVPSSVEGLERIKKIKKILSHPKALEQCSNFFQRHPWIEPIVHSNTAAAAEEVGARGDISCAAIASAYAGELYRLEIIDKALEDDLKNYTRFVTIAKNTNAENREQWNKCSLILQLTHQPGFLAKVLTGFAQHGFNLTKLESRPLHGNPFEYSFYMDFTFNSEERQKIAYLLEQLKNDVQTLKVLGYYKRGEELWTC